MRIYAAFVYLFLYIPIGVIALFSFNAGRHASQLQGFSVQWYGKALKNPFVMDALQTSLTVALVSATCASVFGTMAAVALQGMKGPVRVGFDLLIYVAVMIPGIVIGIATLIGLVTLFDQLSPALAAIWPGGAPPQLSMGYGSLIAAHTLFTMALVIIIIRARLAGMDRAMRAGDLLRTRVDVRRSEQNRALLASMDRRADLALRLQHTVEGLSVVAISYYAVSLAGYLLAPLAEVAELGKATLTAIITLPVVALVWALVRRIRNRLD